MYRRTKKKRKFFINKRFNLACLMPGNIFVSPHYQFHKIYNGKQATKKWMNEWSVSIGFFFAWWCKWWILFFHFHVQYLPMDLWWWQRKKTRFIIVEFEEKRRMWESFFFCLRKLFFHSLFLSAWLIRWSLTKKKKLRFSKFWKIRIMCVRAFVFSILACYNCF